MAELCDMIQQNIYHMISRRTTGIFLFCLAILNVNSAFSQDLNQDKMEEVEVKEQKVAETKENKAAKKRTTKKSK